MTPTDKRILIGMLLLAAALIAISFLVPVPHG